MDSNTQNLLLVMGAFIVIVAFQMWQSRGGKSRVSGQSDDAVFVDDGVEYDVDVREDLNRFEFRLPLKHGGQVVKNVVLTNDEVVPLSTREAIVPTPGLRRRWVRRGQRDVFVRNIINERNQVIADLLLTKEEVDVDGTKHLQNKYTPEQAEDRAWEILAHKVALRDEELAELRKNFDAVNDAYVREAEGRNYEIVNKDEERKEFVQTVNEVGKAKAAGSGLSKKY